MAADPSGYSGTPLLKKLGYDKGGRALLIGVDRGPEALRAFDGFSSRTLAPEAGPSLEGPFDLVHLFATDREVLAEAMPRVRRSLAPTGAFWVSWPKKASGVRSTIDENGVRALALASQLVDVKVCAVDEVWSGLKLVIPVALR